MPKTMQAATATTDLREPSMRRPGERETPDRRIRDPQMPEHVLVVGTGAQVLDRIRDVDARASITLMCRVEMLRDLPAAATADQVIAIGKAAPPAEWVQLAAAAHAARPFTRIGTFGELDQDHAALIGQELQVPTYLPSTVRFVHDKLAMRSRLRDTGADDTPAAVVHDVAGLLAFVSEHGLPCVVKPVQGVGSVGITVAREHSQLTRAFARASRHGVDWVPDTGVLVERFHEGPQYSIETMSEDGVHQVVAVTRKFSDPVSWVELGHLVPGDLTEDAGDEISRYVAGVLDALGVTFGPTHTELVMTSAGPRLIETHIRHGGDEIPALVRDATGVDLTACIARQALGHKVLAGIRSTLRARQSDRRYEAIWFALPTSGGTLVSIESANGARQDEGLAITELLTAGDQIPQPPNSDTRIAFVRASGASAGEAVTAAREAAESMRAVIRAATLSPPEVV